MSDEQYGYPNSWGLLILKAAEEVLGEKGVNSMLNAAGAGQYVHNYPPDNMKKEITFEHMGSIFETIYTTYGKRGAQAIARIAGKSSFNAGVEKFGQLANAAATAMKMGSLDAKSKIGLKFLAQLASKMSDQVAEFEDSENHYLYRLTRCPYCWDWHDATEPVCSFVPSNIQAALLWGTGKQFNIKEIECVAMGHAACVFQIDKTPVG